MHLVAARGSIGRSPLVHASVGSVAELHSVYRHAPQRVHYRCNAHSDSEIDDENGTVRLFLRQSDGDREWGESEIKHK